MPDDGNSALARKMKAGDSALVGDPTRPGDCTRVRFRTLLLDGYDRRRIILDLDHAPLYVTRRETVTLDLGGAFVLTAHGVAVEFKGVSGGRRVTLLFRWLGGHTCPVTPGELVNRDTAADVIERGRLEARANKRHVTRGVA